MKRTYISALSGLFDQRVLIQGWVQTVRDQKKMQFIVVRDHTGLVQVVHHKESDYIESVIISSLTVESAVEIVGKVVSNDNVKLGKIEIVLESINVVNAAPAQLPITVESSLDLRLDWRFLDLRRPANTLIFKVQTAIEQAMRHYWEQQGFIEIHSPKFMGAASESGAELFRVEYFGGHAYLAQSPQFYKQMAIAAGFDKVFEIGPVFRANPSFTSRHDTEFTSVDVELSWINSHEDIMEFEEKWISHILASVKEQYGGQIQEEFGAEINVPSTPFPRITMARAYEMLEKSGHKLSAETQGDLDAEGERRLCSIIKEQTGHEFVFVTDYPISVRPFYHMRHPDNPQITKSFDLLWKGLEITTGAQREHRYDILLDQVKEKGLNPEGIQSYLDCFRYGCPPHGGYGFGLTRVIMILLGLKNVREVTFLYRGPNRLSP